MYQYHSQVLLDHKIVHKLEGTISSIDHALIKGNTKALLVLIDKCGHELQDSLQSVHLASAHTAAERCVPSP